jgi:hypothetical protein
VTILLFALFVGFCPMNRRELTALEHTKVYKRERLHTQPLWVQQEQPTVTKLANKHEVF